MSTGLAVTSALPCSAYQMGLGSNRREPTPPILKSQSKIDRLWISDRKKDGVLRVFDVKNLVKPVSTDWFWNQYLDLSDQKKSRLGDIVCDRSGTLYVRTDSNGRVQKVTDYDAARELSASVLELTVGDTEYKCFKWPDATTQFTSTQLEGLVFNTPTELVNEEKKSKLTAVCHESG